MIIDHEDVNFPCRSLNLWINSNFDTDWSNTWEMGGVGNYPSCPVYS